MIRESCLDSGDVQVLTERLLHEHLSFAVAGCTVTMRMVLNVLLKAGIEQANGMTPSTLIYSSSRFRDSLNLAAAYRCVDRSDHHQL